MRPEIRAFLRASWWGGFAGGVVPLLFTAPFGLFMLIETLRSGEPTGLLWLLPVMPLIVSVPVTAIGLAAFGVPVASLLARWEGFSQGRLATAGGIAGALLMTGLALYLRNSAAVVLPFFGALAGSVSAAVWFTDRYGGGESERR